MACHEGLRARRTSLSSRSTCVVSSTARAFFVSSSIPRGDNLFKYGRSAGFNSISRLQQASFSAFFLFLSFFILFLKKRRSVKVQKKKGKNN